MLNVLVNGCTGKMGQIVCNLLQKNERFNLQSGFDKIDIGNLSFPVYTSIKSIVEKPDVIIDFSVPISTLNILKYAISSNIPIVIATTGFSKEEDIIIIKASKQIPIFKSANMSYEIMILKKLLIWLTPLLDDTDIEITETHHNRKIDSPSGTAQMLADTVNSVLGNSLYYTYNRHDKHEKRNKKEIGIHSIRGGNIVGEHKIQFFGESETFELKHTSYSSNVFAEGALKAAEFIVKQPIGFYTMEDMFSI